MKNVLLALLILLTGCGSFLPFANNGGNCVDISEITTEAQHLSHWEKFGKAVTGYNGSVLKGIDKVQSTAMDGGGYFIGIKANPPESPIGYDLKFLDYELLDAPRKTSYCSGASYTAFIEGLNLIYQNEKFKKPDTDHLEAIRMQEPDGSRREDHVKFWGKWNADGFGSYYALVQYSGMGREIAPEEARPGDFANISWKSGLGHSVVFLSWVKDREQGKKYLLYWSSQKSTNGLGDQLVDVKKIKNIKIVRLTNPEKFATFDINKKIDVKQIKGDEIK
jgi:hypothetical protein